MQRHARDLPSNLSKYLFLFHLYSNINGRCAWWPHCCTIHAKHFTPSLLWTTGVGYRGYLWAPSAGDVWVLQRKLGELTSTCRTVNNFKNQIITIVHVSTIFHSSHVSIGLFQSDNLLAFKHMHLNNGSKQRLKQK